MRRKLLCFVMFSVFLLMSASSLLAYSIFIFDNFSGTQYATVGKTFSLDFEASVYGTYARSWTLSGYVPGLTFWSRGEVAQLSGVPTVPGYYSLTVKVYGADGNLDGTAFSIIVREDKPEITGTLDEGLVGEEYSSSLKASDGTAPYTWAITSGDLPPGLGLSVLGDKAELKGIPTKGGTYSFELTVSDSAGKTETKQFTLLIRPVLIEGTLGDGLTAEEYSGDLSVKGGIAPFLWEVCEGAMPPGLSVISSGDSAKISGTPPLESEGTYKFTLRVTDSQGGRDEKQFAVAVNTLSMEGKFDDGTAWGSYDSYVTLSNGNAPYTWEFLGGCIPAGLSLDFSGDKAILSGVPISGDKYSFMLGATDSKGRTAEKVFSAAISGNNHVCFNGEFERMHIYEYSFVSHRLIYESYSSSVKINGGKPPFTVSLIAGQLPPGLTLRENSMSSSSIVISGTPNSYIDEYCEYCFILEVVDADGRKARKLFSIGVGSLTRYNSEAEADYTNPEISAGFGTAAEGTAHSSTMTASEGVPPYTWSILGDEMPSWAAVSASGSDNENANIAWTAPKGGQCYSFTLQVTDSEGRTNVRDFIVQSFGGPVITGKFPAGIIGKTYSAPVRVYSGKINTDCLYTGTLPAGLALTASGDNLILSGTPSQAGQFKFNIKASNSAGEDSKDFTVDIASAPEISPAELGTITAGKPYTYQLAASGTAPVLWNCGKGLPEGLILMTSGIISGSPAAEGNYTFTVTASNIAGADSKDFTLNVVALPGISELSPDSAVAGREYTCQITASGTTPITFSCGGGLPEGLTFSEDGLLSGTPVKDGIYTFTVTASNTAGAVSKDFTLSVFALPEISTASLDNTFAGQAYTFQFEASGTTPIIWTCTGDIPAGLTFSEAGLLSGTPEKIGNYTFSVTASNDVGIDTREFTLSISEMPVKPDISASNLGSATKGQPYAFQFEASGTAPITWTYEGSLPQGLALSALGLLYGTPTKGGNYTITVKALNSVGDDTKSFTLNILVPPEISDAKPGAATEGQPYTFQFSASGTDTITWTHTGDLPEGLTFSNAGLLSGTPAKAGNYTFTVTASNTAGTDTKEFSLNVAEKQEQPEITTDSITNAITNQAYSLQLTATGTAPLTWTHKGNLPKGLTLDSSGVISGTPTKAGKYTFTVTASNTYGESSKKFTLQVLDSVSISTASLKAGTIGKSYSVTIKAKGSKTITWNAEGLPDGLSINEKGKISGKPTAHGDFTVKITATNPAGSVTESLQLEIKGIAPKISGSLTKATLNESYSSALKVTGSAPLTLSIAGNLPEGLTFDTSTGIISGIPTSYQKSGYKLVITASNDAGIKSKKVTLMVKGTAPKITTAKLPEATVNQSYSFTLSTTGSEPITFTADNLPEGLTLSNGVISGKPTEAAKSFRITVYAENPVKTVRKSFTLKINDDKDDTKLPVAVSSNENTNAALTDEVFAGAIAGEYIFPLGEISCDVPGMYDFSLELPDYVPEDSELVYAANSESPSDDDDIAEFFDDTGEEISAVPASRKIIISIWLNEGVIYKPVIVVKK